MNSRDVFQELLEIQQEINQQIPQPSNRYNDLECVPATTDLDKAIEDLKKHRKFVITKTYEYYICLEIKEKFAEILKQKNIRQTELTKDDWIEIEAKIQNQAKKIYTKLAILAKYLKYETIIDVSAIEVSIRSHLEKLRKNENLFIEKELAERFIQDERLAEHRRIASSQFNIPAYLLSNQEYKEQLENATKLHYFWRGFYFLTTKADAAYCDEHACMALYKVYSKGLHYLLKPEKISVEYGDGVNHTFLVFNRDPNSDLSDISTWGKDAIIFDAWNRIVCYAYDYAKLPVRYPLLHKKGKWSSIKFDSKDYWLFSNLQQLNTFWIMTGNEEPDKRYPLIMQEYQLTQLDSPRYKKTRLFLNKIVPDLLPSNFALQIEFFITTSSQQLVTVINGFEEPKIAIHADFLTNMNTAYSMDEFRFALCRALHQVKLHGTASSDELSADVHHRLDKIALTQCKNASAAISFIKKDKAFKDNHSYSSKVISKLNPHPVERSYMEGSPEQRIKNLLTLLASDEKLREDHITPPIAIDEIKEELKDLKEFIFFKDGFDKATTVEAQLDYLSACLPELKKELHPYELSNEPSKRMWDFFRLLNAIKIDYKHSAHIHAIDRLIDKALELRIPCFDKIYLCCCKVNFNVYPKPQLPAFGVFKTLSLLMTQFCNARNAAEAEKLADEFNQLYERLKTHLGHSRFFISW